MNPPVRTRDHGEALWDGLLNGYVDMIATDHSPHTLEEKGSEARQDDQAGDLGLHLGICGVETAVPVHLNRG